MRHCGTSVGRCLALWLLLGLTVRAFVPAGFMPASFDEGWPVVPCPGVLHDPAGRAGGDPGKSSGHEGHHPDDDCQTSCYLGFLSTFAAQIAVAYVPPVVLPEVGEEISRDVAPEPYQYHDAARSRGPPTTVSISA